METKKPAKKPLRKRHHSSDKSSSEEEICSTVMETKIAQKLRHRPHGVSHVGLATGKALPTAVEVTAVDNDPFKVKTGGFIDMKKLKNATLPSPDGAEPSTIGTEFAAETNQRDEDAQMLKYVEVELAKRRGLQQDGGGDVTSKRAKDPEALLYELPDYLRVESSIQKTEEGLSNQMLSGIPEVDLGIAAKIRNIEATEEAKQKLLKERMQKKDNVSAFVPSNVAVNFMQHNRFTVTESRSSLKAAVPEKPKAQPLRVGDVPGESAK